MFFQNGDKLAVSALTCRVGGVRGHTGIFRPNTNQDNKDVLRQLRGMSGKFVDNSNN